MTKQPAGLDKIKVGDFVAPVRYIGSDPKPQWTGVLIKVSKVTPKRFYLGLGNLIDKATGRSISGWDSHCHYVLATPAMIAEVERKRQNAVKIAERANDFQARPDYKLASAIWSLLDDISLDNHPLDRLTVEEWEAFYNKLSGRENQ